MPYLSKINPIHISCPPLGFLPERNLILKYNKENFVFDIYDKEKRVSSISERSVLDNIENGFYKIQ